MRKIRLITNAVSEGANLLQAKLQELDANVVKTRADNLQGKALRPINIKWGTFQLNQEIFGSPEAAICLNVTANDTCLNKLACFRALAERGVPVPLFTDSKQEAEQWLAAGDRIYVRKLLRASAGEGIEVIEGAGRELPNAPLYTKGMKGKRREYRIHVFNNGNEHRLFVQQKLRRQGFQENPGYTNLVRNLDGGWVFAHDPANIQQPRQVTLDAAVGAVLALGLDFGAVDLIEMDKVASGSVVLEVNTAPGLQGATGDFYAQAIAAIAA